MKKVLCLFAAVAMGMFVFYSCDALNPTDKDEVSITVDAIGSIAAGDYKAVSGKVEGSVDVSAINCSILNEDGTDYTGSAISVTKQTVSGKKTVNLESDADLRIVTQASAAAGNYQLKIEATAGSATSSKQTAFTVTGGTVGTPVSTDSVILGSTSNSNPGSVDLDDMTAYGATAAASKLADIDLCYLYSNTDAADKLFSPAHAKTSGYFSGWTGTPNTTKFFKLSSVSFASVTTKEAVAALWNEASAVTTSIEAVENDVFIAKTNLGAYVLLLIADQTPGKSGTILLKSSI